MPCFSIKGTPPNQYRIPASVVLRGAQDQNQKRGGLTAGLWCELTALYF